MADGYRWVLQLIDRCYDAATNDDKWQPLLDDIRQFLDGHAATLLFTDAALKPIDSFFGANVSPESITDYQAYFHSIDIRMQRAVPAALNTIVTDRDLVDEDIVNHHEFYQDFLRPIGHRYLVSAILDLQDGSYAFCSCHRGLKQDHAETDILERAGLILPHIRRSLQLRSRMSIVDAKGQAAFEVLDGLGQAVFFIDRQGRIVWQNALADHLLRQQDGLTITDGELRTLSTTASTALQNLIKSALAVLGEPRARPGGMMTVPRPSLKRPYQVLVTPLAQHPMSNIQTQLGQRRSAATIFIMDLDKQSVPRADMLRTLYHLTPAEARLATALGSGISIKAYADNTKLSIHYVRWLLKQVEAKTDTRRLTDLISLLARQTALFSAMADDHKENEKID